MDNCGAWDSRAYEAERADAVARGHDLERWRDDACAHVNAWKESDAYQARPFRFEDLAGACEPARWGPAYPKTASASVEKWRAIARGRALTGDEARAYGRAVGAWIRALNAPKGAVRVSLACTAFDAAKHRAKIRAEFQADAARDRREWALGKSKNGRGETIAKAYKRVMREKRARELASLDLADAA